MRLTAVGKLLIFILAIGVAIGGWRGWQQMQGKGGMGNLFNKVMPKGNTPQNGSPQDSQPTGADNEILFLITSTKKVWAEDQINRFNSRQNGKWKIVTQIAPSREGMHAILTGKIKPVLWSPDGAMWPERLNQVWKAQYAKSLIDESDPNARRTFLRTPLVFLTTRQKANFLRPLLGGSTPWLALRDLSMGRKKTPWGSFKFSHADPLESNSGMMTLGLILYDYSLRTGQSGSLERVATSTPFLNYVRELEKKMVYDAAARAGTGALTKAFLNDPSHYDTIIAYESDALKAATTNSDLAVIYPSPTALSEQAVTLLSAGWVTPTQREGALAFINYLGSAESLQSGLKFHFRPAQSGSVSLNDELSSHSNQGFQQSYSSIELPSYGALNAAAFQWSKKIAGK